MKAEFLFPEGKKKVLTFSYDDGAITDIRLIDILSSCGMKGTFNLCYDFFKTENCVKEEQVKELYTEHGMEIANHGASHAYSDLLTNDALIEEYQRNRRELERLSGTIVRGMVYPYGLRNKELESTMKTLGYAYGRTVESLGNRTRYFPSGDEWMHWMPTCHHNDNIMEKGKRFAERPLGGLNMLYIWGHSYEFKTQNTWNVIEEFCDKMKNLPDLWYATNIEIYDYVTACRSLVSTMDSSVIYNPSGLTVFLNVNDKVREIGPGETLRIH